jgi:DNA-binding response OmpR family regulator
MTRRGLVVDDDQRIRQMLTRYFEQEGYRISVAADGPAMRAQLNDSVDVILLDVVMPGEDGLTLAREIRASSDVGIIMLTGRDDVLDRIVGLEVGADDYIAKPFHLREVLARVKAFSGGENGRRCEGRRRSDLPLALAPGRCASPARRLPARPRYQRRRVRLRAALVRHPGRVSAAKR